MENILKKKYIEDIYQETFVYQKHQVEKNLFLNMILNLKALKHMLL